MQNLPKNILKALVILGAFPMLFMLYGIFYRAISENHNEIDSRKYEQKFYNEIVKKCIIVYYIAIATVLICQIL